MLFHPTTLADATARWDLFTTTTRSILAPAPDGPDHTPEVL